MNSEQCRCVSMAGKNASSTPEASSTTNNTVRIRTPDGVVVEHRQMIALQRLDLFGHAAAQVILGRRVARLIRIAQFQVGFDEAEIEPAARPTRAERTSSPISPHKMPFCRRWSSTT